VALADAVGVGLALGRLQAALGDLGDAGVVFADEEGVHSVYGVPGMLRPYLDEHVPVIGELPHRLGVARQERRRSTEESLLPGYRRDVVADGDAREQIYGPRDHARGEES